MKKVFLKDIAEKLNVSKTAVSLVLNNKGDENKISQETQQRIIEYAKKHNYVPNQLARGLSRGKSETIGLIIPNISDTFYSKIAGYVELKAKNLGYTVLFSSSNEDPKKEGELIRSMLNRQVEGLIIASTQQNLKEIQSLKHDKFPFVLIDRHYPESDTNYVVVDNFNGLKTATEHLLQLGRRKIGFITLKPGLEAIKQRLLGYQSALRDFNIEYKEELVKELSPGNYENEIESAIRELLKFPNSVDSIVFSTHYLTSVGLRELKRKNVKVPQEVAIVSFDELTAFDLVDPPITAVIQPVKDIANTAVDILINEIEGKDSTMDNKRILDSKLEIRKSCGTF
ncbi:LacI family DNA-binding transcriptional regulator [Maribacter polysiphoniae]|uniref:LacI family DNA-binding transcriptional regulator n=1 Tax=Maribacter polysiphoniae TaxID=429344 RepID=A0A316E7N9_9FLAO|nr:LacI family DNA-binding transcriptional regulator [Maribacter polysiphoniae]MBD1260081.1 LacI family DNA-binding transcriptional regulator [Maribacter polysiphoniae]PWK25542.1 LacI family transcriptional regulator [Maribacter polysiphoniae]